jgi:hypothetical protein
LQPSEQLQSIQYLKPYRDYHNFREKVWLPQLPVQSINHIHQFGEKVAKFNRHRLSEGKMNGKSPNQGSASKFTGREIKRLWFRKTLTYKRKRNYQNLNMAGRGWELSDEMELNRIEQDSAETT